jgi:hypothetical protein
MEQVRDCKIIIRDDERELRDDKKRNHQGTDIEPVLFKP